MRRAAKRDANEAALIEYARKRGIFFIYGGPFDGIAYDSKARKFDLIEVKHPDKEGHKNEFTPKQRELIQEIRARGGDIRVWRTVDDVDMYARTVH